MFDHVCQKAHYNEDVVRSFIYQLLEALQYLHNCGIAHLDIKPENLLVDSAAIFQLKLIDFGDAQHLGEEVLLHPLRGSPEFSAPELVTEKPVSLSTDMW